MASTGLYYLPFVHAVELIDVVVYKMHMAPTAKHIFILYMSMSFLISLSFKGARAAAQEEVADCGRLLLRRKRSWRNQTHGGQSLTNYHPPTYCFQEHETLSSQLQSHVSSTMFDTWISLKLSWCEMIWAANLKRLGQSCHLFLIKSKQLKSYKDEILDSRKWRISDSCYAVNRHHV